MHVFIHAFVPVLLRFVRQVVEGLCPEMVVQSFLVTIWVGGLRFAQTALVRYDEGLRAIFGLREVGCVSTFTRFFRRFWLR